MRARASKYFRGIGHAAGPESALERPISKILDEPRVKAAHVTALRFAQVPLEAVPAPVIRVMLDVRDLFANLVFAIGRVLVRWHVRRIGRGVHPRAAPKRRILEYKSFNCGVFTI